MQSNDKEIEVKNDVIELTETGTVETTERYDGDIPFPIGSEDYYFLKYSNDEKLKFFLDKMNQNGNKYRFRTVEHVVDEIFRISKVELFYKKKEADKFLTFMPERKDQYIFDEKLKVFNTNKDIEKLIGDCFPSNDGYLDLERSKECLINRKFPDLGYKSVLEVNLCFSLLISYRANLLFIDYLIELSTPAPKEIEQGNDKIKYPTIVIMAVAKIIDNTEGEEFLPDETDFDKKVELTITAIFNKLGLKVGNGIRNHFNCLDKLSKNHKKKVVELLNSLGYTPQARDFRLNNVATNR